MKFRKAKISDLKEIVRIDKKYRGQKIGEARRYFKKQLEYQKRKIVVLSN